MKRPSFQFYPLDWLGDEKIAGGTPEQEGAYIRLLCYMWQTEDCTLPNDEQYLMRISRLTNAENLRVVIKWFQPNDNRLTHKRLILERKKQDFWREKSSKGGKKGMAKRWNNKQKDKGGYKMVITKNNHPVSSSSISSSTLVNSSKEELSNAHGSPEINGMLLALKKTIGIEAFVDSSIERNMAKHCLGLLDKIGKEEFKRRLEWLLNDSFHSKNCNKIKYVYGQIKGWKEPVGNITFIS